MSDRRLKVFREAAKLLSFTKAAEAGRIAYEYSEHILEQYNKMENSIREIPRC